MTRLLTLGWLLCLGVALWIAALTPRAAGYELSLTSAYPPLFWVLTISASSLSAVLLLFLAAHDETSSWSASGLIGIMATNVFVLSLPLWRGYAISDRADALHHIGYTQDILKTGRIGDVDFYPAMHLLQVALETLGGMTPGQALLSINLTFGLLWTLGITLLAQRLAGNIRAGYVAAALSSPLALLSYHGAALPSTLSAMLMPIFLALHLRRSTVSGSERTATVLAEIFLAFLIVYFHPITTLYTLVLLGTLELASQAYLRLRHRGTTPDPLAPGLLPTRGMVTILAITFFTWSFSFSVITASFSKLVAWLLGNRDTSSAINEAVGQMQEAGLPFADLIRILANAFGLPVLVLLLACAFITVLLWRRFRYRLPIPKIHLIYISGFATAMIVTVVMFLISSGERHPIRLLRVLVILSICGLAWWLWESVFQPNVPAYWPELTAVQRNLGIILSGGLLVLMIGIGQVNVYAHPRNGLPNQQVTQNEISGMAWLITHRTHDFVQATILPQYVSRFEVYFRGYAGVRADRADWWKSETWLPAHFYNTQRHCLANVAPGKTVYVALSDAGRISWLRFPESVRALAHVYTASDWRALAQDPSISKLYDSGAFEVWMTNRDIQSCG